MSTTRHGTVGGYTNGGCRCQDCRDASTEYKRDYRRRTNYRFDRIYNKARQHALAELAERHPKEFETLLRRHRAAVECEATA